MRLSEAIQRLRQLENQHGDIELVKDEYNNGYGGLFDIDFVKSDEQPVILVVADGEWVRSSCK